MTDKHHGKSLHHHDRLLHEVDRAEADDRSGDWFDSQRPEWLAHIDITWFWWWHATLSSALVILLFKIYGG